MKPEIIHNGRTLKQIVHNFHPAMTLLHKREYLQNILGIAQREKDKMDLTYAEQLRNRNFILTSFYLNN